MTEVVTESGVQCLKHGLTLHYQTALDVDFCVKTKSRPIHKVRVFKLFHFILNQIF